MQLILLRRAYNQRLVPENDSIQKILLRVGYGLFKGQASAVEIQSASYCDVNPAVARTPDFVDILEGTDSPGVGDGDLIPASEHFDQFFFHAVFRTLHIYSSQKEASIVRMSGDRETLVYFCHRSVTI